MVKKIKDKEEGQNPYCVCDRMKASFWGKPFPILDHHQVKAQEQPPKRGVEKASREYGVHETIAEHAVRNRESRGKSGKFPNESNQVGLFRVEAAEKGGNRSEKQSSSHTGPYNLP